jgi:predicted secreted protein with PEFG-CTERM motif
MASAYTIDDLPPSCVGCTIGDAREIAAENLRRDLPVSVWTDKTDYGHNDIIMVKGQVAHVSGFPITVTVTNIANSLVTIDQLIVAEDGSFETTLNTAGALWKYDGTYTIKVNYGSPEKSNKALVELTGGVTWIPNYATSIPPKKCGANDISASGQCIPYSISGGMVISATINTNDNSIVININAEDDGKEWDDVQIVSNKVTIMFPAGAEQIEVIGTFVIPEFGTIAAMILAVAIIAIIAISAKSRLSIIPRY